MPWCGYWGAPPGGLWWLLLLFGLLFMAVMIALCFRGFGRWSWRPRHPEWMGHSRAVDPEILELRREVSSLRDELQKLRQPT